MARPELNTAPETNGGQFDDREYITMVIYSWSSLYGPADSDSVNDEDTAGSGVAEREGGRRSEIQRQHVKPEYFHF